MPFDPNLFNEKYRIPSARAEWWKYGGGCYHVIIKTKFNRHYFGRIIRNAKTRQNEMIFSKIGKFADESISKISEHQWYASVPVWSVMPDHIHLMVMIDVRGRNPNIDENSDDNHFESETVDLPESETVDLPKSETVDSIHAAIGGVVKNIVSPNFCRDVPWNVSTTKYNTDNHPVQLSEPAEINKTAQYNTDNHPVQLFEPAGNIATDRRTPELMSSISPKTGSLSLVIRQFKQSVTLYAKRNHITFAWQPRFYDVVITKQYEFERVWQYIENNVAKWHIG